MKCLGCDRCVGNCPKGAIRGRITIDGIDIRHMRLKNLRDQIGIVQQDVYLFAGTVMDNIRQSICADAEQADLSSD